MDAGAAFEHLPPLLPNTTFSEVLSATKLDPPDDATNQRFEILIKDFHRRGRFDAVWVADALKEVSNKSKPHLM